MTDRVITPETSRPIETVERVQRRLVLMPRGQKNIVLRETRITLPRVRCIEPVEGQ